MTSIEIAVTPTQVEAARAIVKRDRAKGIETDRAVLTIAAATAAGIGADRSLVSPTSPHAPGTARQAMTAGL